MKSKLFEEKPKKARVGSGRWLYIMPDTGEGYALYDGKDGGYLGRVLVDTKACWIYDGWHLTIDEQEEVAGAITGYQQEMDELIRDL